MKGNRIAVVTCLVLVLISGCGSQFKVVKPDADTGHFTGGRNVGKATIVVNTPMDLSNHRRLLVTTTSSFTRDSMAQTGHFDEVIDTEELQKRIIKEGLEKEIPQISGYMGMKRVADELGPFVWLAYKKRVDNSEQFMQIQLIDPVQAEDFFIAEIALDYVWKGVNDVTVWYPLLNSVVDYLNDNINE
jgi:hypothetical protein